MPFSYSKPHPFMTKKMSYPPCTGTIHTNQLTLTLRLALCGASNLHIRVHSGASRRPDTQHIHVNSYSHHGERLVD